MFGFPFVQQLDSRQCGIACLQMIAKYYGFNCDYQYLDNICFATSEGVSLNGISYAAEEIGMKTICGTLTTKQLSKNILPCIIHWNQNHFVVLYKISRDGNYFYIADPSKGLIRYSKNEFKQHWFSGTSDCNEKGVVMLLEPTEDFGKKGIQKSDRNNAFLFLLRYVLQYKKYFFLLFLGLLFCCILQLIMPFLTQSIVDIGITHKDISFIWLVLLGEFIIVIGHTITDFVRRWLLLHISMRINISLVSDFFIKLLKLPMSFFDIKLTGDIMQRMNDHERIQSFLTSQLLNTFFGLLSFVVFGVVLYITN